jgi:COMPASS component SWD3
MAEASPGFTCQQTLSGPQGHQRSVSALKFSPTTQHLLASGSADKSIHLWDVRDGTRVTPGQGMAHQQGVNDVAWDPQGKYLATVSDDLRILIWDVETGQALRCMKGHSNYIYCCKFDPVGHLLVSSSSSSSSSKKRREGIGKRRRADGVVKSA